MIVAVLACADVDGCVLDAAITPGCGIRSGVVELRLGTLDGLDLLPIVELDLGDQVFFSAGTVSGWRTTDEITSLSVTRSFPGSTLDGVGLKSRADEVHRHFGQDEERDAVQGTWFYEGIGFGWKGGRVNEILVFGTD